MIRNLLIFLGLVIIIVLLLPKSRQKVVGICATAIGKSAHKHKNKQKILLLLEERRELSNSDIREALGVSSSSVARYMDELEREEMVEQIGNTGRNVIYRLK